MRHVSDFSDPEFDELEPFAPKPKPLPVKPVETKMAEAPETEEAREWYVLGQDVNVGGVDCKKGGKLELTAEEAEAMKAAGVRFEGDAEPTPEEIQSKHDEGVEAFNAEIERREEEEKKAKEEAKA